MKKQFLMGIDIGTQSTRVAIINLNGHIVAGASNLLDMVTPQPGWAEQDPRIWWQTTTQNIRQVFSEGPVSQNQILAIGVSDQMHGAVPLVPLGEPLAERVQLWCDKRPAQLVEVFKARPDAVEAYRITGNSPVPSWLGFKTLCSSPRVTRTSPRTTTQCSDLFWCFWRLIFWPGSMTNLLTL